MVFIDVIVRCPLCRELSRLGSLAAFSGFYMAAWTDGWIDPPLREPLVRCGVCRGVSYREHYEELGPVQIPLTTYRVTLIHCGDRRVELMRVLRKWSGGSLVEVRAAIDSLPFVIAEGLDQEKLDQLRTDLAGLGAAYRTEMWQEGPSSPREWLQAPRAEGEDDVEVLRQFLASASNLQPAEEIELRLHLYQIANHPYRWVGQREGDGAPYQEGLAWVPVGEREAWQHENVKRLEELLDPEDPQSRTLLAMLARESGNCLAASALLQPIVGNELHPAAGCIAELARQGISEVQVLAVTAARLED